LPCPSTSEAEPPSRHIQRTQTTPYPSVSQYGVKGPRNNPACSIVYSSGNYVPERQAAIRRGVNLRKHTDVLGDAGDVRASKRRDP
jgi:hypothetical protein